MPTSDEITRIIAVYGALCSTVGIALTIYTARRDRARLRLFLGHLLMIAPPWGERDCNYVVLLISNDGRRPIYITAAWVLVIRHGVPAEWQRATFVVDDQPWPAWQVFAAGLALTEGAERRVVFQFEADDAIVPVRVRVSDGTGAWHHEYALFGQDRLWLARFRAIWRWTRRLFKRS